MFITVGSILLTIIGTLIGVIWHNLNSKIADLTQDLEKEKQENKEFIKKADELKEKILNLQLEFNKELNVIREASSKSQLDIRQKISDLEVTVAEFGANYVTRHEFQGCQDSHRGYNK